ncbi:pilus assembly protein N-terminal domain-containing protein [Adhaeretor mobilis]|uniref:Type II secretion system protein D n=1 Tax=Adhaeretor mobilis TaxID=1930276 RepID=A0A517MVR5_9BACT|nr:pilus assembly protein N-terminal domain-containing protein [Adhaeretor mobilis]QDS98973.1 Type II secretion system protein D precursor [Adhaeretor mobilis]
MYHSKSLFARLLQRTLSLGVVGLLTSIAVVTQAQEVSSVIREISQANDRLEMTVNTSRILTLETRIPRLVVTNPELVTATPISENQVQIAARKPGVTQINLWDENGKVYTVDLMIFGDVRELDLTLKRMFPESTLKVVKLSQSLVLEGQVDRPEIVSTIRTLAEDYAPKVINNISVGGVQQVLLKVKVMEVSRTKLRSLGFDFAQFSGANGIASGAAGLIQAGSAVVDGTTTLTGGETLAFSVINGNDSFFGFLEALQENELAKTLAEPTVVAVSGRPAKFHVGGEVFFALSNGVAGNSVESEEFGTTVDFVPIVLGNGRIRLEVRPEISEIDLSGQVPGSLFTTKTSLVDTGVEMNAGQTLALAGLIQTRVIARQRGLPFLADLPYVGAAFRRVEERVEEIELLIMVTPEFADGLDPHEVPQCGPGMETVSPSCCELYGKGYLEVPACNGCGAMGAGCSSDCGVGGCNAGGCVAPSGTSSGCATGDCAVGEQPPVGYEATDGYAGAPAPGDGPFYGYVQEGDQPMETPQQPQMTPQMNVEPSYEPAPVEPTSSTEPAQESYPQQQYSNELQLNDQPANQDQGQEQLPDPSVQRFRSQWAQPQASAAGPQQPGPEQAATQQQGGQVESSQESTVQSGIRNNPYYRTARQPKPQRSTSTPGLIGPIGYDVQK